MKKFILTFAILISGLFITSQVITGCGGNKDQADDKTERDTTAQTDMKMDTTQTVYACPMHPEVTGKEGEKCSKCGMALVAVKAPDTTTQHNH